MDFFNEDQVADIVGALQQQTNNGPFELEFRIGQARPPRGFEPALNPVLYKNILEGLRTNPRWSKIVETRTVDYYTGLLRVTHDVTESSWTGMQKTKIFTKTLKNTSQGEVALDVRVSAASETPCPVPPGPPPNCSLVREKHRWSFFHKFWRYDVTEVTTHANFGPKRDLDEDRKIIYEIELELVDSNEIIGKPLDYVAFVVRFGLMLCCDMIKLARCN
jgi:hypothetical protein